MGDLRNKARKWAEEDRRQDAEYRRQHGYTVFHFDFDPKLTRRDLKLGEATFQVLTKRSSLLRNFVRDRYKDDKVPSHIWLGVSVEDGTKQSRIRHLQEAPITARFLSIEPLIGPVGELDLTGINWVIVGGESGPRARFMDPAWVRDIRDQCRKKKVAFFFKQWGG